eukprot:TRINITY_DN17470_c0_g1_i1.p1 TRINITY_DN17470_c0_g1~~TRINITY_DN17470_c0_g1_i1.p1  ORF type:complete len:484 (-),score=85.87 TRINITY_DN17470_c0_g1_i1:155-1606(-)
MFEIGRRRFDAMHRTARPLRPTRVTASGAAVVVALCSWCVLLFSGLDLLFCALSQKRLPPHAASNAGVVDSQPAISLSIVDGLLQSRLHSRQVAVIRSAASRNTEEDREVSGEERDFFEVAESSKARLDAVLAERYGQSRSYFERLIGRGAVLVNGHAKKKSYRGLQAGDLVDVRFMLDDKALALEPEDIPVDVLYEDDELLVVNKRPGLVVHPGPGHWSGTLVNAALHHISKSSGTSSPKLPSAPPGPEAQYRPGVAHRLDAGTSGVIVVTKTTAAFAALSKAFADREVKKTYLAVAITGRQVFRDHGVGGGYVIDGPIGRSPYNRRQMAVLPEAGGGRPALSLVREIAAEKDGPALLEITPKTGRTHQIRVHLAKEHAPILGDAEYGFAGANRRFAAHAERPLLHAFRLSFAHPRTGETMLFEAPVPEDMQYFLRRMQTEGELNHEYLQELVSGGLETIQQVDPEDTASHESQQVLEEVAM